MDENQHDKTESKLIAMEDVRWVVNWKSKLWVPKHKRRKGFEGKTLWDWLQLFGVLAIPLVVVGATIVWGIFQAQNSLDQQRADTLQSYIDNIQDLLLNHNLLGDTPLPKNDTDKVTIKEVQELARSRTLTALNRLDPDRKVLLVQFLFEAQLISYKDILANIQQTIIDLAGVDLTSTNFTNANLIGANLSCANPDAEFTYTQDKTCVNLGGANFQVVPLENANLSNDNLSRADLSYAQLDKANLSNTLLDGANLRDTVLDGVDLSRADLRNAQNLTQQQLDQVFSCKGAILPTGLTCHHNQ